MLITKTLTNLDHRIMVARAVVFIRFGEHTYIRFNECFSDYIIKREWCRIIIADERCRVWSWQPHSIKLPFHHFPTVITVYKGKHINDVKLFLECVQKFIAHFSNYIVI